MILKINDDDVDIQSINPKEDLENKYTDYIASSFLSGVLKDNTLFIKCIDIDDAGVVSFEMFVYDKTKEESDNILNNNKEYIQKFIEYLVISSLEHAMKESENDNTKK